jgi:hypothetical protein
MNVKNIQLVQNGLSYNYCDQNLKKGFSIYDLRNAVVS